MGFVIGRNYKVEYRWSDLLAATIRVDIDGDKRFY